MYKLLTLIFSLSSFMASANDAKDKDVQKFIAAAECIGYINMFDKNEQKNFTPQIRDLSHTFSSLINKALETPSIKDSISKTFYGRAGVIFSNDFYAGSIFSGAMNDTANLVKNKAYISSPDVKSHEKLEEAWSIEAHNLYDNANCELIR